MKEISVIVFVEGKIYSQDIHLRFPNVDKAIQFCEAIHNTDISCELRLRVERLYVSPFSEV